MPDFSGPTQALELASWLWLIPFLPLAGALLNALYFAWRRAGPIAGWRLASPPAGAEPSAPPLSANSRRRPKADGGAPVPPAPPGLTARIAVISVGLSAAATLASVLVLLQRAPDDRYLLQPLWSLVRVGQLDVSVGLAFDPLAAVFALLITILGGLVAAFAGRPSARGTREGSPGFFFWLGLSVSAALVVVLADNALVLAGAWCGVAVAGSALVAVTSPGARGILLGRNLFLAQRVGDVALLLGIAVLFWGLGGTWTHAGYQADLEPRISAVSVTTDDVPFDADDPLLRGGAATQGKGFLTVLGLPGSLVYVDDSRTPLLDEAGLPLVTPFRRRELVGGARTFRVAPDDHFRRAAHDSKVGFVLEGGVLANYAITRIAIGGDREVALAVVGPSLDFREIRDQLVLSREKSEGKGTHPFRETLAAKTFGPKLGVVTVACLLFLLSACTKSAALPFPNALTGIVPRAGSPFSLLALFEGAGGALLGVYLLCRLAPIFALSPVASTVVALVGAGTALYGALSAAAHYDLLRILAAGGVSQVGLAFVGLGTGALASGVLQLTTLAVVETTLLLSSAALCEVSALGQPARRGAHDLRRLGGLRASLPRTAWTYDFASIARSLVPLPLLSGFWSLAALFEATLVTRVLPAPLGTLLYALLLVTTALTSFGTWRAYHLVFSGKASGPRPRVDLAASVPSVARVLTVLGGLAAATGLVLGASPRFFGGTGPSALAAWLAPVFAWTFARAGDLSVVTRAGVVGLGLACAFAGWALARHRYGAGRADDWAAREAGRLVQTLGRKLP